VRLSRGVGSRLKGGAASTLVLVFSFGRSTQHVRYNISHRSYARELSALVLPLRMGWKPPCQTCQYLVRGFMPAVRLVSGMYRFRSY